MKKILTVFLIVLMHVSFATTYYVGGPGASDSNAGTATEPFLTIGYAASLTINGDIVIIRSGTYRETITPASSGVTFKADLGATVIVSGLEQIADGIWTNHSGNIFKATVTLPNATNFDEGPVSPTLNSRSNTSILANQIFKGGEMMHMARWPNISTPEDLLDKTKLQAITTSTQTSITQIGIPSGLSGGYVWVNGWFITQTRQITSSSSGNIGFDPLSDGEEFRKFFYVTGALPLLDAAKEWHYESGILYFQQPGGGSPTEVEYKARNYGFDLSDKSDITITGLQFIGCEPVITNISSSNITIDNIRAKYTNHSFLETHPYFQYHRSALQTGMKLLGPNSIIKNSEFKYAGGMGVWLGSNTTAQNNLFEYTCWNGMYSSAIKPAFGADNVKILYNTFAHTGRGAIELTQDNMEIPQNLEIGYNDMSYFNKLSIDGGAVYASRTLNLDGMRVHHNWFHDSGVYGTDTLKGIQVTGVYLDQAAGPVILDHNVHWNGYVTPYPSPYPFHSTDFYNQIKDGSNYISSSYLYNNTFASLGTGSSYFTGVSDPTVADKQTNNIYRRTVTAAGGAGVTSSLDESVDPFFVGTGQGGLVYKPRLGSKAINTGTNLAGYTDDAVDIADKGAYEDGGHEWIPGYVPVPEIEAPATTPPTTGPLVFLKFDEGSGTNPVNDGSATSTYTRSATIPASSSTIKPVTVGGANSFDWGTATGNYYVESSAAVNELKSLTSFTITGWLNSRSSTAGSGGNRVVSWINNGGDGVDLVYRTDGSLQLGVDQWPDSSPAYSSASKVTTDVSASAGNWVFFAVTYQSTNGQTQFYFGNNSTPASLDVVRTYNTQGAVGTSIGKLAVGHFNDATRNSGTYDRMFRGLIDDVRIYGSALTLSNILAVQQGVTDGTVPSTPTDFRVSKKAETTIDLAWTASTDNVAVTGYEVYKIAGTTQTLVGSPTSTSYQVTGLSSNSTYTLAVVAKDAALNTSAASVIQVTTNLSKRFHIEAEDYASSVGTTVSAGNLESTDGGDNAIYNVTFPGTYNNLATNYANGNGTAGSVKVRTGTITGTVIGTLSTDPTGGWGTFTIKNLALSPSVSGAQTIVMDWYTGSGNGNYNWFEFTGAESESPSTPVNLASPSKTDVSVSLTWTASTDNVAVAGYDIYRDGTILAGTSATASFTVPNLLANTPYKFTVKARDAAGNISGPSNEVAVTTNGSLVIEAESASATSGVSIQPTTLESTDEGDWASYNVTLGTGYSALKIRYARGNATTSTTEFWLDNIGIGTLIGTLTTSPTGGWGTFVDAIIPLSGADGTHTLYITWPTGSGTGNGNFDKFTFLTGDLTAPSTPSTLTLVRKSDVTATLSWTGSSDNVAVTGYDIYTGATLRGSSSSATQYVVSGLTPSTAYTFTVKARDAMGNVSAASNSVAVTTNSIPDPWVFQDINGPTLAGSASYTTGTTNTYTVNGSGLDIGGTADQFAFMYQGKEGDGTITAKILSLTNTNSMAKAGIMIRETLTAGSTYAMVNLTPGGTAEFSWRSSSSGTASSVTASSVSAPYWLRLTISGNSISAYKSPDGNTWTQVGTQQSITISIPNIVWGLAVVSKTNSALNTSTFDNISLLDNNGSRSGRKPFAEQLDDQQEQVEEKGSDKTARLYQNYPNPFNGKTTIKAYIPTEAATASIQMYDAFAKGGREINIVERGEVEILISSDDLKSGLHFYYLKVDGKIIGIKRLISVR